MLSVQYLLVLLLQFGLSAPEDVTEPVTTLGVMSESPAPVTELVTPADSDSADDGLEEPKLLPDIVDISNVIYNVCNCTDELVDCRDHDLRSPFEIEDWIGLRQMGVPGFANVDLSQNRFVILPQFPSLPIKRLNLSSCEIEIVADGAFSKLKYLTTLDLSRNKMSFVFGKRVFWGVTDGDTRPTAFMYLQHLSLAYNDIHSLSQDVFTFMPHLATLDLSGNALVTIDQVTMGALSDLMRLRELRISECDLETLPTGIFRRLRKLQRLDLSGNRFAAVPKTLSEAINLQYLNFNRNPIQAISERTVISDNLSNLQELHLSRLGKLRSITKGGLGGLENLVKLYINYNPRLTNLDPKFLEWEDDLGLEKWPQLEELYLNNNNLSGIDPRFLERWDRLAHADFGSNPYDCHCTNQWMVKVLVPLLMRINVSAANMRCRRPYDYRGLSFAQLHELRKEMPCAGSEADTFSTEIAVWYGILVGVLIALPLVLCLVIIWKKDLLTKCGKKMTSKKDYYDDEEIDAF